jgi:hypothetical protein
MKKQDRQGVRTAQQLEQKYDYSDQTRNAAEARRGAAEAQAAAAAAQAAAAQLAHYITARGTDGIWTYEKWSNGHAVCWCATEETTVNGYAEFEQNMPGGLFIEDPEFASVSVYAVMGNFFVAVTELSASAIKWHASEYAAEASEGAVRFMIEVKGKWM